jgi:PKD repeat protein
MVFGVMMLFLTLVFTSWSSSIQTEGNSIIWSVILNVNEKTSGTSDFVEFGEASDAIDGAPADSYDVVKPPAPIPSYIRMYLDDNLPSPYDVVWKDFRYYPGTSKVWNLSVQWVPSDYVSPTTVTISWDPNNYEHSEYGLVTLCTEAGVPLQNMLIDDTYTFNCVANIPQGFKIICTNTNNPPVTPSTPSGETTGYHGKSYNYSTSTTDPDGDNLSYRFDWGDNTASNWFGPYQSGELIQTSYIWETPGAYQVKVKARDIYGKQSNWSMSLSVEMMNKVPFQPTSPSPQNGSINIQTNPVLSWTGTDPDGDIMTYDVYFGTTNPPSKIVYNQSGSSFNPGALYYQTTYYWKIISWDTFRAHTTGPVWSFTTKASDDGSPGGPNGDTGEQNTPPVANASLGEQSRLIGSLLVFNGSRSYDADGYLTRWFWDFGDGANGSGEITTHTYRKIGLYTVTLTVTDDKGATGTDTVILQILSANKPPTKPEINGTRVGTKNHTYMYTIQSTDPENDFLWYIVTWGDDTQNMSNFQPNGTVCSLLHSWDFPGKYMITAIATDNITMSEQASFSVFIDVYFVGELGFLFDGNNDGFYDSFYTNITGNVTNAQKLINGSYLLDIDNDGNWNYLYDPSLDSLTKMNNMVTTIENQWVFPAIIILAIVVIACIIYFYKKKFF